MSDTDEAEVLWDTGEPTWRVRLVVAAFVALVAVAAVVTARDPRLAEPSRWVGLVGCGWVGWRFARIARARTRLVRVGGRVEWEDQGLLRRRTRSIPTGELRAVRVDHHQVDLLRGDGSVWQALISGPDAPHVAARVAADLGVPEIGELRGR